MRRKTNTDMRSFGQSCQYCDVCQKLMQQIYKLYSSHFVTYLDPKITDFAVENVVRLDHRLDDVQCNDI